MIDPAIPIAGAQASSDTTDDLLRWREEFPTLETTLHFISHSLGAMPRKVEEELALYAQAWKLRGIRAWEESWMALPTEVGNLLGSIVNAPPASISMHENVTMAQCVALSAIGFDKPRNRLVCTDQDFPSVLYLYQGLARHGVEVVRVPSRSGHEVEEADVIAAIDERTAVVAMSHVLFRNSKIMDVAPIVRRAHEVGALVMLDSYQAIGTVPVDVQTLGVDLMAGGSVKWLCGGPGAGYLYVSPTVAPRLRPAVTGWMAHANPFAFDSGAMQWHEGARRFWTGTPGIPAFTAARPGYEIIAGIGVEKIRRKSLRQTERMLALADEYGLRVGSPRASERRGGTVVLDVPNADRICATLLAQDVLLDFRPGVGLRLAPHFYTHDDEVDEVMRRVRDAART